MSRILVVDDALVDRRLVGGLLEKADDLSVEYAENGAMALEQISRSLPDLVVTDLIMPEVDGLELVERVHRAHPRVPIILMTSAGNEEIAVEALKRGASSYVPKRSLAAELLPTALDLLALAGKRRERDRLLGCMTRNDVSLVIGNDRTLISVLVQYLQDALDDMEVCDESDRMRVGVALEEALVNALFHGNLEVDSELREQDNEAYHAVAEERRGQSPYRNRKIFVDAHLSREKAVFVIRDEGPGFDPESLPDPTDPANLERVSGRGVFLMKTFMDELRFNPSGNQVTLTKRCKINTGEKAPSV